MLTHVVAITAALASSASAFECAGNYFSFANRAGSALSYQRLDPSLYPGTTSPHMHSFDGGDGLSATSSYQETQNSKCSTARVKSDKSLYWRPTLYFNGNNTGFYRVPEKELKIYYKYGEGGPWANVTEFPEDFNMMAGEPLKRADGNNAAGVRWACHKPDGAADPIFTKGFPTGFKTCEYGFASEVTFPSCWNGQKTDPKNPHAHMAYPTGQGIGTEPCPTTHRAARFPTIFIEFWYDISSFKGQFDTNKAPWVLSNGDPTGFGFHADFLNGWKKGVLAKATAETGGCRCGCGCGQAEMEQCFGAADVNKNNDPAFEECSVMGIASENEAAPVIDALPGCNPIQAGPASATVVTGSNCAGTGVPAPGGGSSSTAQGGNTTSPTPANTPVESPVETPINPPVQTPVVGPSPTSSSKGQGGSGNGHTRGGGRPSRFSYPNKQQASPTPGLDIVKPNIPASDLPSPTPAQNNPTGSPSNGNNDKNTDGEECKAPVYVTVTPTVYITAGTNATSCGLGTVTKTLTQTATITVPAQGGFEYGSY